MRLGIATCRPLPEPDVDEELMLAGFAEAGFEPVMVDWQSSQGEDCDLLVIRSTWDYHLALPRFLEWLDAVEGRVLNPAHVCRWNVNKTYLGELKAKGVPIVPTLFPSGPAEIPWDRFVVKPTVSCGSFMTRVFDDKSEGEIFIRELSHTHDPMIQPYMASVEGEGERSIIWIDGQVTHGIRKNPRFSHEEESVSPGYDPSDEERAFAEKVIAAAPGPLLYARVDVMRDDEGKLTLSELELIEPSLFLTQHPPAMDKLIEGSKKRL